MWSARPRPRRATCVRAALAVDSAALVPTEQIAPHAAHSAPAFLPRALRQFATCQRRIRAYMSTECWKCARPGIETMLPRA
jgi:hypothetical protein